MDIKSLLSPSDPTALNRRNGSSSVPSSATAQHHQPHAISPHDATSLDGLTAHRGGGRASRATNQQTAPQQDYFGPSHGTQSETVASLSGNLQSRSAPPRDQSSLLMRSDGTSPADHRPTFAHRLSSERHVAGHGHVSSAPGEFIVSNHMFDIVLTPAVPAGSTQYSAPLQSSASSATAGASSSASSRSPHRQSLTRLAHPPNLRTLSNRSLATVTMDTAPAQTPTPRQFSSNVLSDDELSTVTSLLSYLNENSYAHSSHVQLINLLHQGFVSHSSSSAQDQSSSYSLLSELRQAREAMDSRFAVGEALWLDWLQDEIALARSSEERLAVTELAQRAVQDEPASTKLWQTYVDWIDSNHAACHDLPGADTASWLDEDKEICRDFFTRQMLLDVLEQAAKATTWRVDSSHVLWNKYLSMLTRSADESETSSRAKGDASADSFISSSELGKLFITRLQTPHANLEETFELFLPLASQLYTDKWEATVARFEGMMNSSRKLMKIREAHESKLRYAIDTNDPQGLFEAFEQYLKWDRVHKQRSDNDKELRCSLFERALLHFPTHRDWWIAYIDFVISQQPSTHNPSASVLPLIERATRHCPWAGELWARRILRSDYERLSHDDIEACKHRATNSGLLDVGGMEDLLKVLVEWCSYLRRHAFTATATEDDRDTAEVGMTMALEDVQQAGRKLYGADFQGDPLFRIEKIQIKFLSEARRMNDARRVWRSLIPSKKDSHEFWFHYYNYEITLWIHDRVNDATRVETTETGPRLATAVVEEAIAQHNLDWPEKVHEMYVNHFQWHESVERMQDATIVAWAFQQKIAAKRAKDAEAAAAAADRPPVPVVEAPSTLAPATSDIVPRDKRKRDDDGANQDDAVKRAKKESEKTTTQEAHTKLESTTAEPQQKRDREHLSVTVTNLQIQATELDIRKFFRDCGEILSVALSIDQSQNSASAVVEFASQEDVEAAKTRNGKQLLGRELNIRSGSLSTLYVANYPPEFDEDAIRKLFATYGEILSVRFPSLKYNNRRRFCYVQFTNNAIAKAAEAALDGKMLDGSHKLLAKISDPDAKKQRGGAQAEGRELFVKNIDNNVPEEDVKAFFAELGSVLTINLLKNVTGRRLGNGFIVYSSADEAARAIEELNNKPLGDRILHVALSQPKAGAAAAEKAKKTDIIVKHAKAGDSQSVGSRRDSDVSMMSDSQVQNASDSFKTVRERQVAILNLPDTVTDARIAAEMEKHGQTTKIQLRRNQNAAIVEFADVKVAFAVREGIDCKALGPDTKTADVKELFANDKSNSKAKAINGHAMMPSQVGRPALGGGSRRGGLGFKRGGLGGGVKSASTTANQTTTTGKAGRSNADFKTMFESSRTAE